MAVAVIQLPSDGTGKMVAARSYTESANTVYAQAGYITTDTAGGNPAAVSNAALAGTEYGLATRSLVQGTQAAVSTTSWTSGTGSNTANSISVAGYNTVTVAMSNTSTMTGGVLTFEVSPDSGTTWFPVSMARIDSYTVENTYTLSTVTPRAWSTSVDGFTNFRVRLSTVITGTGTATVFVTAQTFAIEPIVAVGQATAANLNATVTASAANWSSNVAQINAVTPLMGNGVTGTGSLRVTIASDTTANSNPYLVNPRPATTGGHSTSKILSAATTNATSVKGSAGQLYGWYLFNSSAASKFVKIFNKASAPTVGTDSPLFQIALPAGGAANVFSDHGIAMGTGIAYAITNLIADLDATAVAASDVAGALFYT